MKSLILLALFWNLECSMCCFFPLSPAPEESHLLDPPNQLATPAPPPAKFASCGQTYYYHHPSYGIVGGIDAKPSQYPWMARLLLFNGSHWLPHCGASIIDERYLLTAAHCIDGQVTPSTLVAIIGDHYQSVVEADELAVTIARIIVHPYFNILTVFNYDFALLEIDQTFDFTQTWTVQKVCLPTSCNDGCGAGTMAYIAGWGLVKERGQVANTLQTAYIQLADSTLCREQYANTSYSITENMICGGYINGGIDTCQGDSGGPMMTMENGYYMQCGVTSFGEGCARPNYFGVYAKVCTVLPWIQSYIGV